MQHPPIAARKPFFQTHHGITTQDDYHWLRAENWQDALRDPQQLPDEIKAYLQAENAWYEEAMRETGELQAQLLEELKGRIEDKDEAVPDKWGPYAYNMRFDEGAEHPLFVRTPRDGGPETVLLDANLEAERSEYFDLGMSEVSPSHKLMAWSSDDKGSELYSLRIRDLESARDRDYRIEDVSDIAWCNDEILFYAKVDENYRSSRIFRHRVGSDPQQDMLVLEEQDPRFSLHVERSLSDAYIFLCATTNDEDECRFIPVTDPYAEPTVIEPRQAGVEYSVDHQGERFIILTNADEAEDFKIVTAPVEQPGKAHWQTLVEHQQGRTLLDVAAHKDWLIWTERENALPTIRIMPTQGEVFTIAFDEEAYFLRLESSLEYDSQELRFLYSSPTTPAQIFDYDLNTRQRSLRKQQQVPSGHQAENYITRRIHATSHDGAEVPITLLYHKDTALDGSAPCYLYGYGSYGASIPAGFSHTRLSLVDRGFVAAIAHIRGGMEKGKAWYETAKLQHKPNTFKDFIAVARHLIEQNYTSQGNIVCHGGSAGGLLIGAVVNMAPELFAAAIADVPFVDVLNTILDDTLPLTPGEWTQWGNPLESADAYGWIAGYSPYDNVSAQDYPAMLVTAGVSDPRVTYWEPAKWVARLRVLKTDHNLLLLKTNMSSGHFGKSGRYAGLEDIARNWAFAIRCTNS